MEINIKTAYDVGQILYATIDCRIVRYRVEAIRCRYEILLTRDISPDGKYIIEYKIRELGGCAFLIDELPALVRFSTSIEELFDRFKEQAKSIQQEET